MMKTNMTNKNASRGFIRTRYTIYISIAFFVLIGAFVLHNTSNLILGPTLNASITHQDGNFVRLEGVVKRTSHLTINDRAVPPRQDGVFSQELFVSSGHTIMTIRARDRFGRSLTHTIPIYTPSYASKENENNEKTN